MKIRIVVMIMIITVMLTRVPPRAKAKIINIYNYNDNSILLSTNNDPTPVDQSILRHLSLYLSASIISTVFSIHSIYYVILCKFITSFLLILLLRNLNVSLGTYPNFSRVLILNVCQWITDSKT